MKHEPQCSCDCCLISGLIADDLYRREQAWQQWYERDRHKIQRYVKRRSHVLGCPDLAEDIVQETFVIAYSNLYERRFEDQGKALCAYLYGIARNLLYASARHYHKESANEVDLGQEELRPMHLEDRVCLTDFLATVAEAHARLAPKKRRVVDGLYLAGKDSQQLGQELAQSAVNVRAIASRAVTEMRSHVAERYSIELPTDTIRLALQCLDAAYLRYEN